MSRRGVSCAVPADRIDPFADRYARTAERISTQSASSSLTVAALGVVYGDIGTSPLYAVRQSFRRLRRRQRAARLRRSLADRLGADVVVTLKYVIVLMRADNRGEGGILALTVLALRAAGRAALAVDLLGRALRLGAVLRRRRADAVDFGAERGRGAEGRDPALRALCPAADPLVLLIGLFLLQRHGTGRGRRVFRPGHGRLVQHDRRCSASRGSHATRAILLALDPLYGDRADRSRCPWQAFVLLGAVVSGGDRGRGTLCRYGAFRAGADSAGLAALCVSGVAAELFRARGAAARPIRQRSRTRSSGWRRTGRSTRSSGSPRRPRSSPRRRSSPAPSR